MDISTISQVTYNFTTSSAVVIGGIWAYFKFIRGRVFSYRAELSVVPTIEERAGLLYLRVVVELKNTGLSKLPLNAEVKHLQLYRMSADSNEWEWLSTQKILINMIIWNLKK